VIRFPEWAWLSGCNVFIRYGVVSLPTLCSSNRPDCATLSQYGTKHIASPSNYPGSRYGTASTYDSSQRLIVIGSSAALSPLPLASLHPPAPHPHSPPPPPQSSHTTFTSSALTLV